MFGPVLCLSAFTPHRPLGCLAPQGGRDSGLYSETRVSKRQSKTSATLPLSCLPGHPSSSFSSGVKLSFCPHLVKMAGLDFSELSSLLFPWLLMAVWLQKAKSGRTVTRLCLSCMLHLTTNWTGLLESLTLWLLFWASIWTPFPSLSFVTSCNKCRDRVKLQLVRWLASKCSVGGEGRAGDCRPSCTGTHHTAPHLKKTSV